MMEPKAQSRHRALRLISASLISSDFSARELRDVAESLHHGALRDDLFHFLMETSFRLSTSDSHSSPRRFSDERSEEAYDLIQKKRIPKSRVFELVSSAIGSHPPFPLNSSVTVRDMLDEFFSFASEKESELFIKMISGVGSEDPYLNIIARNSK